MFSSLKSKFLSITRTVPLFKNPEQETADAPKVNLSTGSEILSHFQHRWEILHNSNEENARKADEVAEVIAEIHNKVEQDQNHLNAITDLLNNSNLQSYVENCTRQLEQVYGAFEAVELGLLQLENLIEDVEFETLKNQHRHHLNLYKLRQQESLDQLEAEVKAQHAKCRREEEAQKLQERHRAFKEASDKDLENFKSSGEIPKLIPKPSSALLEEIQIDYDETELKEFLEDSQ